MGEAEKILDVYIRAMGNIIRDRGNFVTFQWMAREKANHIAYDGWNRYRKIREFDMAWRFYLMAERLMGEAHAGESEDSCRSGTVVKLEDAAQKLEQRARNCWRVAEELEKLGRGVIASKAYVNTRMDPIKVEEARLWHAGRLIF